MIEEYDFASLSAAELDELYRFSEQQFAEARPADLMPPPQAWADLQRAVPAHRVLHRSWTRGAGGALEGIAGTSWGTGPQNRHLASVAIQVRADRRRRGVGSALLADAARLAQREGRTVMAMFTWSAVPAGAAFCQAVGATAVLEQRDSRLRLADVDRSLLRGWIEAAERAAGEYELVFLEGRTPPELVPQVARAVSLMKHAPRGDSRREDEDVTPEEVGQWEDANAAAGRRTWSYFVRHRPSGELVAFTDIRWHPATAGQLNQGGTAVHPDHRGRDLGKWIKAAMLMKVLAELPEAETVITGNAYVNDPMLSINDRLGFKPDSAETSWELETEAALRYTSRQSARPLE